MSDSYEAWARRQLFRRHRFKLIAIGLVAVGFLLWFGSVFFPFVGTVDRSNRTADAIEADLSSPLDQKLDAFIARLAPKLTAAGYPPSEFKSVTEASSRNKNADGVVWSVTPHKSRKFERPGVGSEITIQANINADTISLATADEQKRRGIAGSIHFVIIKKGPIDCHGIADLAVSAIGKPIDHNDRFDSYFTSKSQLILGSLFTACLGNRTYVVPSIAGLPTVRGELMAGGDRWWLRVDNTRDVQLTGGN
jgi:hypothetical protein